MLTSLSTPMAANSIGSSPQASITRQARLNSAPVTPAIKFSGDIGNALKGGITFLIGLATLIGTSGAKYVHNNWTETGRSQQSIEMPLSAFRESAETNKSTAGIRFKQVMLSVKQEIGEQQNLESKMAQLRIQDKMPENLQAAMSALLEQAKGVESPSELRPLFNSFLSGVVAPMNPDVDLDEIRLGAEEYFNDLSSHESTQNKLFWAMIVALALTLFGGQWMTQRGNHWGGRF